MGARKWSNDRIEDLRAEWAKGLSVAAIAQRLGTTRSAVTGKIKRLGLNKHAHSKSPSLPRRNAGRSEPVTITKNGHDP